MNGIRFYEEFKDEGQRELSHGTVVAVITENRIPGGYDAIGSTHQVSNGSCASTSVTKSYLTGWCRRISEKRAREIHPRLFAEFLQDES